MYTEHTITLFFLNTDNIYNTSVHFTVSTIVLFYITIDEIMIIILEKKNLNETPFVDNRNSILEVAYNLVHQVQILYVDFQEMLMFYMKGWLD